MNLADWIIPNEYKAGQLVRISPYPGCLHDVLALIVCKVEDERTGLKDEKSYSWSILVEGRQRIIDAEQIVEVLNASR